MRAPLVRLGLLLSLLIAPSVSAVTMAWTPIENPGNAADTNPFTNQCGASNDGPCGPVAYSYNIGTYEVTTAQYVEFLNAKAKSDPYALWNPNMGPTGFGGSTVFRSA